MPVFLYKAITAEGRGIEGSFTANTAQEVTEMLRQKQSYPVSIEEENQGSLVLSFPSNRRVNVREIAVFCRQFYAMLNAGVNIINCLDILRLQLQNKRLRAVTAKVYEDVQKGMTLSEGLKRHREVFPTLLIYMVESGEISGALDNIMNRMAIHYEKEYKLNNKIKGAMLYPIILAIVAIVVVIFLLNFVMPTFINLFQSSGVALPLPTRILLAMSMFMQKFWLLIFLGVGLAIFGFRAYAASEEGRKCIDELTLRLPIIKDLVKKIIAARFTRTMSTMMGNGIPLLQALESVGRVVNNVVIQAGIERIREAVRRGQVLSEPVKASGLFPPMVHNMIRIGEESGALDELLDKSADYYDEEVEMGIQRVSQLLEPAMIVVMALIIGYIVISMVLPMFDMMNTVQ